MCNRSEVAIAVISKDKSFFEQVKNDFKQSDFYKDNTDIAEELLGLFKDRYVKPSHLIVIHEDSIRWYGDINSAWTVFSEICDKLNLQWTFMRVGEDDYYDVEEDNNYYKFDYSDLLLPNEVFAFIRHIRFFV